MSATSPPEGFASIRSAIHAAADPETALRAATVGVFQRLGDRAAHTREGALKAGEQQFFVAGVFLHARASAQNVLVAEVGFPHEQHRLRIPSNLGHPGWVVEHRRSLLLANTDEHSSFEQILKTSRMGSAIYAPLMAEGRFHGQLIMAAQARDTFAAPDLDVLEAVAREATAAYLACGGPAWFAGLPIPPR